MFNPSRMIKLLGMAVALALLSMQTASAASPSMHIMEGFLPPIWCVVWTLVALPFWWAGYARIKRLVTEKPELRLLLGLAGAYVFLISALKLPSVTGSSSHPTGIALGTILFGPPVMSILGSIALLFQALLLAHGGLTTLGANTVSMAIVGSLSAWGVYWLLRNRLPLNIVVFTTALVSNLATYSVTSAQLALAYPDATGGFLASFLKFAAIFALTQIPLAVSEGILTALVFSALRSSAPADLVASGLKGI